MNEEQIGGFREETQNYRDEYWDMNEKETGD